ncbi:MAG: Sir2 silent information regulator family NAD-dependent deacetylase [Clostridia bacterium]
MKNCLNKLINEADKVVIGAGSGLSASAGLTYSGKRFEENFSDFIKEYGLSDMYSSAFYNYPSMEIFWAYFSRHIFLNRYDEILEDTYKKLLKLVKDKDYFVISTNVDHAFIRSGFDTERLFCTQGNYGLFQCSKPCHDDTYENESAVMEMLKTQKDMKIPTNLIPHCPKCGALMSLNLRKDDTFVQDKNWYKSLEKYEKFIDSTTDKNVVFLEFGVGYNTPGIIKYPFWNFTYKNKKATYVCINLETEGIPPEINNQSFIYNTDANKFLDNLLK